jgi:hypothetical protein
LLIVSIANVVISFEWQLHVPGFFLLYDF